MNLSTYRGLAATATALVLSLAASSCSSADGDGGEVAEGEFPETIVLGAIPAENSTSLAEGYDPIVELLERETGSEVELSPASDYAGVVEGLIAGNVDLAFLGSFGYIIATENDADITVLGAVTEAKDADPGYYSLGITQGGNDAVDGLEDFAGKDVCFVDPGSTSGFLYPSSGLIEAGVIDSGTEEALSSAMEPIFAGAHDASALAVKNGDCEVGFAMQPMVEDTLVKSGELQDGDLKEVWKSPMISGSVFIASNELGEETIATLTDIFTQKVNADYLLEQGMCEGECLLTDEDAWGVKPAQDSDYDGVREVCIVTKSDACDG